MDPTRALFASPPLALASFALTSAALLAERLGIAIAHGGDPETDFAPLLFWALVAAAFGAFWLVNALRLAGLVASPPNRLTSAGTIGTALLGALVAPIDLGGLAADALVVGLSSTCFATCLLLQATPRDQGANPWSSESVSK